MGRRGQRIAAHAVADREPRAASSLAYDSAMHVLMERVVVPVEEAGSGPDPRRTGSASSTNKAIARSADHKTVEFLANAALHEPRLLPFDEFAFRVRGAALRE